MIVNPAAARGQALRSLPATLDELRAEGAEYRVVHSQSLDHAREEAASAAANGESVLALGGDGLVGALAAALSGSGAALVIVASGRGNDFARVLGLPRDPVAAARLAVRGDTRLVDLGEVDGTPFVGIASVGIDSDTNRIAMRTRLVSGRLVYFYACLLYTSPSPRDRS